MANSGTVTAGSAALASQYNNLRADVLDISTGHTHNGIADSGARIEGTALKSTGSTTGQFLTSTAGTGAAWADVPVNVGEFGTVTVSYSFGTPSDFYTQYSNTGFPANTCAYGIGGGGTVVLSGGVYNGAATSKTWNTFNVGAHTANATASAIATATITASPAGTIQASGIVVLQADAASATAVYFTERTNLTTSGTASVSMRKYTTNLVTNVWTATVAQAASPQDSWSNSLYAEFHPGLDCFVGALWSNTSGQTATVFTVADASGSVRKADFGVNTAGTAFQVLAYTYVPPDGAGLGTVWAVGTAAGVFRRVAYSAASTAFTAASTANDWNPVGSAAGITSLYWDSAATAIVWVSNSVHYQIDRTFGTVLSTSTGSFSTTRRIGSYAVKERGTGLGKFDILGTYAPPNLLPSISNGMPIVSGGTLIGMLAGDTSTGTAFTYSVTRYREDQETAFSPVNYGRLVYDRGGSVSSARSLDDRISLGQGTTGASYLPANGSVVIYATGGTTVPNSSTQTLHTIRLK